ncbi:hypothetical protein C8R48DRAFT_607664 [Suillus tomentosus]|nr:hypothetical protein C8R48DRAFT_607664 [Suillus tomentosus]
MGDGSCRDTLPPQKFCLWTIEYLAVQLLGVNVDELRARCPLPAVVSTLVVADQMISALEHIQKNKLVHCDLKTGNIFIHPTDSRHLYLVD